MKKAPLQNLTLCLMFTLFFSLTFTSLLLFEEIKILSLNFVSLISILQKTESHLGKSERIFLNALLIFQFSFFPFVVNLKAAGICVNG